jgi:hypothetical protein
VIFEAALCIASSPPPPLHGIRPAATLLGVLPNGSTHDRRLPQVLQAQQHGEHAFELAVEMDLIASKPLQLVRAERLADADR